MLGKSFPAVNRPKKDFHSLIQSIVAVMRDRYLADYRILSIDNIDKQHYTCQVDNCLQKLLMWI